MQAESAAQDTQFVALSGTEADPKRFFPLKSLFDTVAYRASTKDLEDDRAKRIDDMQSVFKEMRVPVQFSTTDDRATVAIIFERVNRQGVALDTLQLLSAWTWSEEFALQEQFSDLADELEPFGFKDVGEDTTLLLRCCSAVLAGDASAEALIALNGAKVRASFDQIMNGVKYAVDYMRANFAAEQLANLPFSTMLIPLAVFFAVAGNRELKYRLAAGPGTKNARVIAMLNKPAGTTITAIMAATAWQRHSVRGFLAGIVRKKLGLNLVSDQTDKGRVYRIKEGKALSVATDRD
jgi:Protein of unknown function (DUF3489)